MTSAVHAANILISSDSHVIEPVDLWEKELPMAMRDKAPRYPKHNFSGREGGTDPKIRVKEMAMDGVSAEILYPSLAMNQFGMTDAALQEACLRIYNDWLIEYCSNAPDRLFGVATISTFNIDHAIREAQRCKDAGMRGVMIWQVPPDELAFTSGHYDRFWGAVQELDMPVSLHILTGTQNPPSRLGQANKYLAGGLDRAVNEKMLHAASAISRIIAAGVLEHFPRLKLVLVENEISWLPFVLSQWDKYAATGRYETPIKVPPSEYFRRQIFATFFDDPPSRWLFEEWGSDNCMWSNDFPHRSSTWPNSREVIARDLGHLPPATRAKLTYENVVSLYKLPAVEPMTAS